MKEESAVMDSRKCRKCKILLKIPDIVRTYYRNRARDLVANRNRNKRLLSGKQNNSINQIGGLDILLLVGMVAN